MAGPTLSLAIATDGAQALSRAMGVLQPYVTFDGPLTSEGASFTVSATLGMAGRYSGVGRPFLLSLEEASFETSEAVVVQQAIGTAPCLDLVVAAMCNAEADHLILAELSAFLAEQLHVLVLLESYGPLPSHIAEVGTTLLVAARSGSPTETRLVAPAVLRAWASDPSFSLVK